MRQARQTRSNVWKHANTTTKGKEQRQVRHGSNLKTQMFLLLPLRILFSHFSPLSFLFLFFRFSLFFSPSLFSLSLDTRDTKERHTKKRRDRQEKEIKTKNSKCINEHSDTWENTPTSRSAQECARHCQVRNGNIWKWGPPSLVRGVPPSSSSAP